MKTKIEEFDFRAFGEAIKSAWEEKGWTREQLGAMIGISDTCRSLGAGFQNCPPYIEAQTP